MNKAKIYQGQSLFDIANESTGNAENAFAIALLNGISITDDLVIGQEILIVTMSNKSVVSFFEEKRPATGITVDQESVLIPDLGIGTMVIGSTFIVR